jgi:hypothetical protein
MTIGHEAAGEIVELPSDEDVLSSDAYKKRRYGVGTRVAFACIIINRSTIGVLT